MKNLFSASIVALLCAAPAFADVTVSSPAANATVGPTFVLTATAGPCSAQPVTAMGYSLDSSSNTTIVSSSSITANVSAPIGSHVLHVKSWGNKGASCTADVPVTVASAPASVSDVTVSQPATGASVNSPFAVAASGALCKSQPISAMGYSIDSSSNTTIVNGGVLNGQVNAASGAHTLHVKAWGNQGASCNVDIPVNVSVAPPSTPTAPSLPATDVSVSQPLGGASVASPFTVSASGTQCKSQPISAMGYSLDNSSNTVVVNGKTVGAKVSAAAGSHVLHIKAWGANGASCVNDVPVTVTAGAPTSPTTPAKSGPSIPEDAVATKLIQNLPTWKSAHDEGTPGTSTGTTNLATTPSQSGSARQFATSYTNYGGHRYHVSLNPDANSTNFVFDAQVYIAGSAKDISNVEMDLNQVLPNGQTVIYGFQCDAWSNTWDYTANTGTPTSPNDQWLHSNQACNARNWTPNAWHHVQIQYSRDSSGNVTYQSVWLDGVKQDLNVTVNSAFALGWGPALLINFQIDGYNSTSGSSNVYLDNVTLYSW